MALKSKPLQILFVDDDRDLVDATNRMLQKLGHVATTETDSLGGLRAFSQNPDDFDLAIVDPTMSDISGLDLATRFRRIQPGFPVILYGGDITPALIEDANAAGISCCQKPASRIELENAIKKALKLDKR